MKRFGISLFCVLCFLPVVAQQNIDLLASAGKTHPVKLSEIATSIQTVQLETTDDCLLVPEQMHIYYGKESIFAFDGMDPGNYYRFTLDGKFINRIGKPGPGPEEYREGGHFMVDEAKNEFWIQDWRSFSFYVYTFEGKFKRKVPVEKGVFLNSKPALNGERIVYANCHLPNKPDVQELFGANAQTGKLQGSMKSTLFKDRELRSLYLNPILYTYKDNVYYTNTLQNVIHRTTPTMQFIPVYQLNIGKINDEDLDDLSQPSDDANYISLRRIYEKDAFILFSYVYKGKSYWSVCSKKDWTCRNAISETGFINDLEPNEKPSVCSFYKSESEDHLIGYIPDEIGEDNPAIVIVKLKK